MRVREWYGYHFPEMVRLVNDNYQYCQLVRLIKMRKVLTDPSPELMEQIEKIVMDTAKPEFEIVQNLRIFILAFTRCLIARGRI